MVEQSPSMIRSSLSDSWGLLTLLFRIFPMADGRLPKQTLSKRIPLSPRRMS